MAMWNWTTFGIGCLGAIAPEVARLYKSHRYKLPAVDNIGFYILISALFVGIGGALAVILDAENWRAALYIGVSWPALLSTAVGKAPQAPKGAGEAESECGEVERGDGERGETEAGITWLSFREYLGAIFPYRPSTPGK